MAMTIKPVTKYIFQSIQEDITYNLGIDAASQVEAADKLMRHLSAIVEEVKALTAGKPRLN
jgi:hypothetical protein